MMNELALIGRVFIGVVLATVIFLFGISLGIKFSSLGDAREEYTRCITDGGIKDYCVRKYLLPPLDIKKGV